MSDIRAQRLQACEGGYPRRLAVLGEAAPVLHVSGTIRESAPAVAVVGARAASSGALRTAHALARHAGQLGGVVVSGGAIGVDTAAHRGALDASAATTVVLGTGVDVPYPARNAGLFAEVVRGGGALVSMFPDGSLPLPRHFVARNRVIAGLADVVVVVEASLTSGSLYTARHAAAFGRPVAAVPGSAGTDGLLAAGAALVEGAEDLDRLLAGAPRRRARLAIDGDLARALAALDVRVPRDAGDVAGALGISLARAAALLADLEDAGWTFAVPGACYVRAP